MKKVLSLLIFAPIAIALIVLSVANRHPVRLNFDPINTEQPFLAFSLPFFIFLFIALITGLLLGAVMTWFSQAKYRKLARQGKREAVKWQRQADEQKQRADQAQMAVAGEADASSPNRLSITNKAA